MKIYKYVTMTLGVVLLSCSGDNVFILPPQHWQDIEIVVEPRPAPVRAGSTEFLVRATAKDGRAAHDLIISLRMDDATPWRQAIQDGQTGVYRRGLAVKAGQESLFVQLRRKGQEDVLTFPLHVNQ
jgi:hypothetical protein